MESAPGDGPGCVGSGNGSFALAFGRWRGSGLVLLLFLFLPARSTEELSGFFPAGNLIGPVGRADGVWGTQQPVCGNGGNGRPVSRSDPADAAGDRHGDGAIRARTQRGAGECP